MLARRQVFFRVNNHDKFGWERTFRTELYTVSATQARHTMRKAAMRQDKFRDTPLRLPNDNFDMIIGGRIVLQ